MVDIKLNLHAKWLSGEEGGERADLSDADLRGADLRGANLRGANLDFSSGLTLSCSSLGIKSNLRLVAQLAYHLARVECDAPEFKAVMKTKSFKALANSFHRVEECGKIG